MWITGFDVPSCSTIYLDKPMRNHTLMQTIARANRVVAGKENGLIVDYVGIFRDLQKALAIYATGSPAADVTGRDADHGQGRAGRGAGEAIAESAGFCTERGVDLRGILPMRAGFAKIRMDDAASVLVDQPEPGAVDDSVEKIS